MSCILYYSNQCEKSKKTLQSLARGSAQKDVHFMCIDKRIKVGNNFRRGIKYCLVTPYCITCSRASLWPITPPLKTMASHFRSQLEKISWADSASHPIISAFWTKRATSLQQRVAAGCGSSIITPPSIFMIK